MIRQPIPVGRFVCRLRSIYLHGLMLGPVMIAGGYLGKQVVDRLPAHLFTRLIDLTVAAYGLWFLVK
jgi:uncharacterized membrane protein YfcA